MKMFKNNISILVLGVIGLTPWSEHALCDDKDVDKAKPLRSGLQVGESVQSFDVIDVTGKKAGQSVCYACDYGTRPVVNVFVRELDENVVALIDKLNGLVAKNQDKKLAAFVVLLSLDPDEDKDYLKLIQKTQNWQHIPLTVFDGITGPKGCKIHRDAEVTVVLWNQTKVESNHAFSKGKFDKSSIKKIINDVPKILK